MGEDDSFSFLDPLSEIFVYRQHLPHWRQEGVLYFVTFRLADSIPSDVLEGWLAERRIWFAAHGIREDMSRSVFRAGYLKIPERVRRAFERDQARKLFVELDKCHGACPFRNSDAAGMVRDSLHFYDGTRLRCGDFVIMPNHVHWLLVPLSGYKLENILQSIKSFTATRLNKLLHRHGKLWQRESLDHIVRDVDELERIRDYIAHNPLKAKLRPSEHVLYCSDWL